MSTKVDFVSALRARIAEYVATNGERPAQWTLELSAIVEALADLRLESPGDSSSRGLASLDEQIKRINATFASRLEAVDEWLRQLRDGFDSRLAPLEHRSAFDGDQLKRLADRLLAVEAAQLKPEQATSPAADFLAGGLEPLEAAAPDQPFWPVKPEPIDPRVALLEEQVKVLLTRVAELEAQISRAPARSRTSKAAKPT